jgi:hypothetical protein
MSNEADAPRQLSFGFMLAYPGLQGQETPVPGAVMSTQSELVMLVQRLPGTHSFVSLQQLVAASQLFPVEHVHVK